MANTPSGVGRQVAETMTRVSKVLQTATKESLRDVAKVARAELNKTAAGPTGGDRRFSNMRRYNHAGRLSIATKQRDSASGRGVWVLPRGPWNLAESGAVPHRVNHPGTRQGTQAWTRGQAATHAELERTVPKEIGDKVEEAFGG